MEIIEVIEFSANQIDTVHSSENFEFFGGGGGVYFLLMFLKAYMGNKPSAVL